MSLPSLLEAGAVHINVIGPSCDTAPFPLDIRR